MVNPDAKIGFSQDEPYASQRDVLSEASKDPSLGEELSLEESTQGMVSRLRSPERPHTPISTSLQPSSDPVRTQHESISAQIPIMISALPPTSPRSTPSFFSSPSSSSSSSSIDIEQSSDVGSAPLESRDTPFEAFSNKLKSICTHGLLTLDRLDELGLRTVVGGDINPDKWRVCLNHIYSLAGINRTLTAPANGIFPLSYEGQKIDDANTKESLEGYTHHTMLIVILKEGLDITADSIKMELLISKGEQVIDDVYLPSRIRTGCAEIWANGSIPPGPWIILAPIELVKQIPQGFLREDQKLIGVSSITTELEECTLETPDYATALTEILNAHPDGFFIHGTRW